MFSLFWVLNVSTVFLISDLASPSQPQPFFARLSAQAFYLQRGCLENR